MKLEVWGQTDVGLKRTNNQDTFLIDSELGLFIVADGMGGHKGGEVASALAVQTVREVVQQSYQTEHGVSARDLLGRAYREASQRIFQVAAVKEDLKGMGTTMVVALFRDNRLHLANVGDSRAYLIGHGGYWQMTEDHSLLYEHLRAGLVKEEDIGQFMAKNIITRSVGFESEVACDIVERHIEPGEMILICSDGLSGLVRDQRIAEICYNTEPARIVPILIEEAKRNGGDDNITCLLLVSKQEDEKTH